MWTPTPTAPSTPAPRANTWDARRLFLLCPRHFRKGSKATRRPLLQWDRSADFGLAVLVSERRVVFITFGRIRRRSEEHTSELQSLMRISYAVFCLKKKNTNM